MPVKIKKIPQSTPPVYMPPPGMEPPSSYMQPPPGVYAPTIQPQPSPVYMPQPQPQPQVPFNYYGQQLVTISKPEKEEQVIPGKEDEYNIITETPYQFHYDTDRKLAMLTKPKVDKLLESINGNVFDQIQKVIDEINKGYDYVKKTKILLAQLDYYPHLRPHEKIIRKATNLTADTEPFSLEKLQERICTDSWLALFFKKADETRNNNYIGKKLTPNDWKTLKQIIISYYFNFFLFKKYQKCIKQDKIPTFATICLRYNEQACKFKDFAVWEIMQNQTNGFKDDEPLFLPDSYLEKLSIFRDDMKDGKYSDIFDVLKTSNYKFLEDPDNKEALEVLKKAGVPPAKQQAAVSTIYSNSDTLVETAIYTASASAGFAGGWLMTAGALSLGFGALLPMSVAALGTYGAYKNRGTIGGWYSSANELFNNWGADGAIVSDSTKTVATGTTKIGVLKKDSNGKWVQSGFFNTLCIFVDETLDNCFAAYVAKNGPINWGKPSSDDKPFDLSAFADCQIKKRELGELAKIIEEKTERDKIIVLISEFPEKKCYKDIRDEIDNALERELDQIMKTDSESTKASYRDNTEVQKDKKKAEIYLKHLSPAKITSIPKKIQTYKDALAKPTWSTTGTSSSAKIATFADGRASTPDGGANPQKSPTKSKKPSYKRSPQYDGLKSAYKDGRISKDQFKDGKREIKRSFRRGPRA